MELVSFLSSGRYIFSHFRFHSCLICDLIRQICLKYPLFLILPFAVRSLCSLKLRHCHLDKDFGRMVFSSLLEASSSLSTLDISGNSVSTASIRSCILPYHKNCYKLSFVIVQIGGWLSKYDRSGPLFSLGAGKSLQSLRLLNLRYDMIGNTISLLLCKLFFPTINSWQLQ